MTAKANQYFLRGFNLDHGTDFATSVDGMPVNLPSHGHGQGYTDLNFLIPELVERIEYRKGPYFATHGDFAAAGAADIVYKARVDAPLAQLTLGHNGYRRGVGAASTQLRDDLVFMSLMLRLLLLLPLLVLLLPLLSDSLEQLRSSSSERAKNGSMPRPRVPWHW